MIWIYIALGFIAIVASFVAGAIYGRKGTKVAVDAVDARLDSFRKSL